MEKVVELWFLVVEYARSVRTKGLDGLQMWIRIKGKLSEIKYEGKWFKNIYIKNRMLRIGVIESESGVTKDDWEKHHFMLQHANIPYSCECNFVRLMQIAYNCGQLAIVFEDRVFTDEMREYYKDMELDKMLTYMGNIMIGDINKLISDKYVSEIKKLVEI
jgi:hypothetical protein